MRVFMCVVLMLTAFCLFSCSPFNGDGKITYNGLELSEEDIKNIGENLGDVTLPPKDVNIIIYKEVPSAETVYWTQSGTVWHLTTACSHIKQGSNVYSGDIESAIECDKERLCSACKKNISNGSED